MKTKILADYQICISVPLSRYGPKIWNALPFKIKTAENLKAFKTLIKKWNGASSSSSMLL